MQVIPVLDLKQGRAVHAVRGDRGRYAPVQSPLAPEGDALALARAYRALGAERCYAADLDALTGHPRQLPLLRRLAGPDGFAGPLLLDAAAITPEDATRLAALGHVQVVIALETLPSFTRLAQLAEVLPAGRLTFSLDLRDGTPIGARHPEGREPVALARAAHALGVTSILLLDLARVGAGLGVDEALARRLREALPDVELLVGGGVRDASDLAHLAALGADGALVASALQTGAITAADLTRLAKHRA